MTRKARSMALRRYLRRKRRAIESMARATPRSRHSRTGQRAAAPTGGRGVKTFNFARLTDAPIKFSGTP